MLRGNWSSTMMRLRQRRGLSAQFARSPRAARSNSAPKRDRMMPSSFFRSSGLSSPGNQSLRRCLSNCAVSGTVPNQKSRTCRASSITFPIAEKSPTALFGARSSGLYSALAPRQKARLLPGAPSPGRAAAQRPRLALNDRLLAPRRLFGCCLIGGEQLFQLLRGLTRGRLELLFIFFHRVLGGKRGFVVLPETAHGIAGLRLGIAQFLQHGDRELETRQ